MLTAADTEARDEKELDRKGLVTIERGLTDKRFKSGVLEANGHIPF